MTVSIFHKGFNFCEVHVSLVSDLLSKFTPDDTEVVKKTLSRIDEQDKWNDVFSTKLIELLDNIDGLKKEIRERMRRVESIKFAESVLLDEAARTEVLNTKVLEAETALESLRIEFLTAKDHYQGAETLRKEASETFDEASSRYREAKGLAEGAAYEYRQAEEIGKSSAKAYMESERSLLLSSREYNEACRSMTEAAARLSSASQLRELAERSQEEANKKTLEAKGILDQSIGQLNRALTTEEKATADLEAARQDLVSSERKRLDAAKSYRSSVRWTISASTLTWTALAWTVWSAFRFVVPVWAPCAAAAILVFAGILVLRGMKREA